MKDNILYANRNDVTVMYGDKPYRIQNDRGYKHIVVFEDGKRRKITVKEQESDCVFDYIFNGGFQTHPCPAMDYWIMRHRMKRKITTKEYKETFLRNITMILLLFLSFTCKAQSFGTTDIGYSSLNKLTGSMMFGYKVNNWYVLSGTRFHVSQKKIPANFSLSFGTTLLKERIMIDAGCAYVFNLQVQDRYFSPEHDTVLISDGYKKQAYFKPIASIRIFVYKELYVGYSYVFNAHYLFTGVKFDL